MKKNVSYKNAVAAACVGTYHAELESIAKILYAICFAYLDNGEEVDLRNYHSCVANDQKLRLRHFAQLHYYLTSKIARADIESIYLNLPLVRTLLDSFLRVLSDITDDTETVFLYTGIEKIRSFRKAYAMGGITETEKKESVEDQLCGEYERIRHLLVSEQLLDDSFPLHIDVFSDEKLKEYRKTHVIKKPDNLHCSKADNTVFANRFFVGAGFPESHRTIERSFSYLSRFTHGNTEVLGEYGTENFWLLSRLYFISSFALDALHANDLIPKEQVPVLKIHFKHIQNIQKEFLSAWSLARRCC